jgi:hypothetical protein
LQMIDDTSLKEMLDQGSGLLDPSGTSGEIPSAVKRVFPSSSVGRAGDC